MNWNWLARDQGPELASSRSGNRNWPASNQGTAPASMRSWTGTGQRRVREQGWQPASREQHHPQLENRKQRDKVCKQEQESAISGSWNRDGGLRRESIPRQEQELAISGLG